MSPHMGKAGLLTPDSDNDIASGEHPRVPSVSVLIADADDESRAIYARFAALHGAVASVSVCATPPETIEAVQGSRYDIVVIAKSIDIDPWHIIDEVGAENMPATIVVAECGDDAVKAFELRIADYLVYPVASERFLRGIGNAIDRVTRSSEQRILASLATMISSLKENGRRPSRFLVQDKNKYAFINAADIDWIEAADNYVILHVSDRQYFVRDTMSSMESRLEDDNFIRVHRSAIINVDRVKSVEPWGTEFRFVLCDGKAIVSGRRFRDRLRSVLLRG